MSGRPPAAGASAAVAQGSPASGVREAQQQRHQHSNIDVEAVKQLLLGNEAARRELAKANLRKRAAQAATAGVKANSSSSDSTSFPNVSSMQQSRHGGSAGSEPHSISSESLLSPVLGRQQQGQQPPLLAAPASSLRVEGDGHSSAYAGKPISNESNDGCYEESPVLGLIAPPAASAVHAPPTVPSAHAASAIRPAIIGAPVGRHEAGHDGDDDDGAARSYGDDDDADTRSSPVLGVTGHNASYYAQDDGDDYADNDDADDEGSPVLGEKHARIVDEADYDHGDDCHTAGDSDVPGAAEPVTAVAVFSGDESSPVLGGQSPAPLLQPSRKRRRPEEENSRSRHHSDDDAFDTRRGAAVSGVGYISTDAEVNTSAAFPSTRQDRSLPAASNDVTLRTSPTYASAGSPPPAPVPSSSSSYFSYSGAPSTSLGAFLLANCGKAALRGAEERRLLLRGYECPCCVKFYASLGNNPAAITAALEEKGRRIAAALAAFESGASSDIPPDVSEYLREYQEMQARHAQAQQKQPHDVAQQMGASVGSRGRAAASSSSSAAAAAQRSGSFRAPAPSPPPPLASQQQQHQPFLRGSLGHKPHGSSRGGTGSDVDSSISNSSSSSSSNASHASAAASRRGVGISSDLTCTSHSGTVNRMINGAVNRLSSDCSASASGYSNSNNSFNYAPSAAVGAAAAAAVAARTSSNRHGMQPAAPIAAAGSRPGVAARGGAGSSGASLKAPLDPGRLLQAHSRHRGLAGGPNPVGSDTPPGYWALDDSICQLDPEADG